MTAGAAEDTPPPPPTKTCQPPATLARSLDPNVILISLASEVLQLCCEKKSYVFILRNVIQLRIHLPSQLIAEVEAMVHHAE